MTQTQLLPASHTAAKRHLHQKRARTSQTQRTRGGTWCWNVALGSRKHAREARKCDSMHQCLARNARKQTWLLSSHGCSRHIITWLLKSAQRHAHHSLQLTPCIRRSNARTDARTQQKDYRRKTAHISYVARTDTAMGAQNREKSTNPETSTKQAQNKGSKSQG